MSAAGALQNEMRKIVIGLLAMHWMGCGRKMYAFLIVTI
jgi:hypothetical protein